MSGAVSSAGAYSGSAMGEVLSFDDDRHPHKVNLGSDVDQHNNGRLSSSDKG